MKMSFFTPIPSGTLSYLCPWGLYPSPQRAPKSTAVSKVARRILAQRPHIILTQQETTLEITGNKILGEGKGVNLGEHYSTCRAGKLAGFNSIFPWLQAYHWGWLLDVWWCLHVFSISNGPQAALLLFIKLLRVFAGGKHRAVLPHNICLQQHSDWHQSGVTNSSKFITALLQHCDFFSELPQSPETGDVRIVFI